MRKISTIILSIVLLTSCSIDNNKTPKPEPVKTITVVDIQTGDTIQINLSYNGGVPTTAHKISK